MNRLEDLERRARVLAAVVAAIFVILAVRLGQLQIVQGAEWEKVALGQRIRLVATPAPRGNIYDRDGTLLATNEPAFFAYLVYTGKPMTDETVRRLSEILRMEPEAIREAERQLQPSYKVDGKVRYGRPYQPVPLKMINEDQHTLLEEYREELPGAMVAVQPVRLYPGLPDTRTGRRIAAHVLGQVKRDDSGVAARGEYGVEAAYNSYPTTTEDPAELGLQGKDGLRQVEVDAQGRPTRVLREQPAVPGNNVVLTLNARLQAAAEDALLSRMDYLRQIRNKDCPQGCPSEYASAVALDVRTGEILAMASVPSFDPNDFAGRIYALPGTDEFNAWQQAWRDLQKDSGKPLTNHATMDGAPPGSTFKPITAIAALEAGVTTPETRVSCPGEYYFGITFKDWRAHGVVNLEQALARSCNVYFYEMAGRMKIERLAGTARDFGLGSKTGLEERDGISEVAGWVASPETKRKLHPKEPTWYTSQNLSVAIGQDDTRLTPLQMAMMTAAIANGGTRYRPYVVKGVTAPDGKVLKGFKPEVLGRVQVSRETLDEVRKGMLAVNQYNPGWTGPDSQYGTGYAVFGDFPQKSKELLGREIKVAGKTGTAEAGKNEEPYGWFIAFAPFDKPEIAVAVMVRHGGGGSLAAAPVARAMLDEYFGLSQLKKKREEAAPPVQRQTGDAIRPL